jgi:hypothetical protein
VVGNQINNDPQAQIVSGVDQFLCLGEGSEDRVDVAVIGDVVAGVFLRGAIAATCAFSSATDTNLVPVLACINKYASR